MNYKCLLAFLCLATGSCFVTTTYATEPQVCSPSKPCAYSGNATAENGLTLSIKVYISDNGAWVATFYDKGNEYTAYVIEDGNGKYHINYDGRAYYFNI